MPPLENTLPWAIVDQIPAEVGENDTFCQSSKRTKDGIACRFPGKLNTLKPASKLRNLLCKNRENRPAGRTGNSPDFILPKLLLDEIQEKRRTTRASKKNNTPAHSATLSSEKSRARQITQIAASNQMLNEFSHVVQKKNLQSTLSI